MAFRKKGCESKMVTDKSGHWTTALCVILGVFAVPKHHSDDGKICLSGSKGRGRRVYWKTVPIISVKMLMFSSNLLNL